MAIEKIGKNLANSFREDYLTESKGSNARQLIHGITADLLKNKYPILFYKYGIQPIKSLNNYPDYNLFLNELLESSSITAAYQLSSFYSLLICQEDRYRNGVYFTPPMLSNIVIKEIKSIFGPDLCHSSVIDPCSGGGAFLTPLVSNIRKEMEKNGVNPKSRIQQIVNKISGIDVNDTLNELTKIFCLIEMYADIEYVGKIPNLDISTGNFLTSDFSNKLFDIVIGNPPFRRLSINEQSEYKDNYSVTNNGGSNLYGLFAQKSLELVKPGGVVSLILPASILAGARYSRLRSFIGEYSDILNIHTIQERTGVFMDVQQETIILTLKKLRKGIRRKEVTKVSTICDRVKSSKIGKTKLPRNSSPWIIPRRKNQLSATSLFSKNLPTLEDYGITIRTGSVVWNRDKRPRYSDVGKKSSREKRFPLIWSDCIGHDGTFQFDRAKKRAPNEVFVGTDISDTQILRTSSIAIKRTTNSKQSRRIFSSYIGPDFVKEYGGYLGENHVNILLPKREECLVNLELLSDILNCDPIDDVFRCISGTSAVSKYELSKLPLPNLDLVEKRLSLGEDISEAVRVSLYDV